ncbi:hypothetical protein D3P05_16360, partial [Paracoccus siganidrum]
KAPRSGHCAEIEPSSTTVSSQTCGFSQVSGSFLFFFALGYGARLLAPLFRRPRAWQWLEAGVGTVMWSIALRLMIG